MQDRVDIWRSAEEEECIAEERKRRKDDVSDSRFELRYLNREGGSEAEEKLT